MDAEKTIIELSKTKAYKAIERMSMEMRNRRYEIRMNSSGKKVFLSVNNRSKLLAALYHCMIHQESSAKVWTIDVYSGESIGVDLTVTQMQSIVSILDKKNDDIDKMVSKYYKKIREYKSLKELRLVLTEIIDMHEYEAKRYYRSME